MISFTQCSISDTAKISHRCMFSCLEIALQMPETVLSELGHSYLANHYSYWQDICSYLPVMLAYVSLCSDTCNASDTCRNLGTDALELHEDRQWACLLQIYSLRTSLFKLPAFKVQLFTKSALPEIAIQILYFNDIFLQKVFT